MMYICVNLAVVSLFRFFGHIIVFPWACFWFSTIICPLSKSGMLVACIVWGVVTVPGRFLVSSGCGTLAATSCTTTSTFAPASTTSTTLREGCNLVCITFLRRISGCPCNCCNFRLGLGLGRLVHCISSSQGGLHLASG